MSAEPIPEKPKPTLPVDQKWLQDLINKEYGTNETIEDVDCQIIGEGQGFLSVITKADLAWTQNSKGHESLPKSIVIKKPTDEKIKQIPMMKDFFTDGIIEKVHNTEVGAYEYFNLHGKPPIPMARCIYLERKTNADDGLLILETIPGRSLTFNDSNSFDQLKELAGHIGAVQAYSFKYPEYTKFLGPMPFDGFKQFQDGIKPGAVKLREKYPKLFTVTDEDIEKGLAIVEQATDMMMHPEKNPYVKTLALGDMQPNNCLWKLDNDGNLTTSVAALLDFQICHIGTCFHDISNVVMWGVSSKDHDEWLDQILCHYYKTLEEKMEGKEVPVTLKEIKDGYTVVKVMIAIMLVHMVNVLEEAREVFKLSQEKIEDMVRKCVKGFADIDAPVVKEFLDRSNNNNN